MILQNLLLFLSLLLCLTASVPSGFAMARKPPVEKIRAVSKAAELKPLTLDECFKLSLKRSETLAIEKEDVEIAKAQFFKATGEVFGDVDFLITDFRQDAPRGGSDSDAGGESATTTSTAFERRERKFVISQPLFRGFKSVAALKSAGSLKKQRKSEWKRAEELLFTDVSSAFYDVLYRKRDVETIETIMKSYEERVEELNGREKIGRSREGEVATAVSKMQITSSELARAKGNLAVSEHVLEFLTGIPIDASQLEDAPLPDTASLDVAELLKHSEERGDVKAAGRAVIIARSKIIDAQSGFWPQISLDGNVYNKREGFQKDIDWDVLFKINVPLSRGGENLGKLKEVISGWKQAKQSLSLAKRKADLEIKQSYQNWLASYEESEALHKAVEASQKNFDLQKEDYSHNLVSNLDVLAALEELSSTKRQANQIYYEMKKDYWRLQVAAGILNEPV